MKTQIITIATVAFLALGFTETSYAVPVNNQAYTVLADISTISKIEVYGNVELYVSDATIDQVKVYNKYYSESALVQSKNGVLRISSYKNEKLVVWVSAADLRSISAYDNAEVKSFGSLSKIELNVDLHNNASAELNVDTYAANITLTDHATANVSGTATDFTINRTAGSSINKYSLSATNIADNRAKTPVLVNEDLAGL